MNVYLLIAIALSAMSAVTEAPAARTSFAQVASECGIRADERAIRRATSTLRGTSNARVTKRFAIAAILRVVAPLAGAITPRAPAFNR
jgi:hypothetical protein